MRAVVLNAVGEAPILTDRIRPVPGPGEALVRIQACGLCGSDLFLADGGFGDHLFPVVPGHEAAGEVVALGGPEGPEPAIRLGQQVALYYIDNDPGAEHPHLGPGVRRMGVDADGAMAEYVVRPTRTLITPPEPMSPEVLAVLTDAVATPLHALARIADVQPGERVLVLGVGGVGSNAVQLAHALGAHVVAAARSDRGLALAEQLGADRVVRLTEDSLPGLHAALGQGADVVVQCAATSSLDALAIECAAPRGRVVLVAANRDPFPVCGTDLIWRELSLRGSRGFTPDDIRDAIGLYLRGEITVDHLVSDVRPLEAAPAAFADLRAGRTTRVVLAP